MSSPMICRKFREFIYGRLALVLVVCLALVSGVQSLAPARPEDGTTSSNLTGHDPPPATLAGTAGNRIEKQAPFQRLFIFSPERNARLSSVSGFPSPRSRIPASWVLRHCARCQLYSAHTRSSSPDDPGDPFPS